MKYRLILTLILVVPSVSFGASFDCAKATTQIEKFICSDATLSDLDEQLSVTYARARLGAPNPQALVEEQMNWLKSGRGACKDASCLQAAYARRIAELRTGAPEGGRSAGSLDRNTEGIPESEIEKDEDVLPQEIHNAAIRIGMPYADAKKILLAAGWHVVRPDTKGSARYSLFPEVSCGGGMHAICSLAISKGSVSHTLIVHETKEGLVIDGSY